MTSGGNNFSDFPENQLAKFRVEGNFLSYDLTCQNAAVSAFRLW